MLESLFATVHSIVSEFNSKRALSLFVLILVVFGTASLLEWYTDYLAITRLERSAALLEKLQSLKLTDQQELRRINAIIVKQLEQVVRPRGIPAVVYGAIPRRAWLWKALAAAAPVWLLIVLSAIRLRHKPETLRQGLVGLIAWSIGAGLLGAAIPAFFWPWGNLLVYPIIEFVVVIVAVANMGSDASTDATAT